MLQLNFLEFVFRVIPESFMITYGIILLSEEKICLFGNIFYQVYVCQ